MSQLSVGSHELIGWMDTFTQQYGQRYMTAWPANGLGGWQMIGHTQTPQNFNRMPQAYSPLPVTGRLSGLYNELDTNKDGTVSWQELQQHGLVMQQFPGDMGTLLGNAQSAGWAGTMSPAAFAMVIRGQCS